MDQKKVKNRTYSRKTRKEKLSYQISMLIIILEFKPCGLCSSVSSGSQFYQQDIGSNGHTEMWVWSNGSGTSGSEEDFVTDIVQNCLWMIKLERLSQRSVLIIAVIFFFCSRRHIVQPSFRKDYSHYPTLVNLKQSRCMEVQCKTKYYVLVGNNRL